MKMRFSEASVNISFFSGLFEGRDLAWGNGVLGLSEAFSGGKVPHPKTRPCRANEQPLLKNQYI